MQKASAIVQKTSTEKDNNDEDLIELEGCSIRTTWRFPKDTKECPALRCDFEFSTHSACRNHFKKVHAKHAICCPECHKQYVAFNPRNFLLHFQNAHPNARMPFKFEEASTVIKEDEKVDRGSDDSNNSKNTTDEDTIKLYDCGITTKWRVPDGLTKCPVLSCQQEFKMRSTLMSHYKEKHANGSILCAACVPPRPIRVNHCSRDYINHYERQHPDHVMPFVFGQRVKHRKKVIHFKSTVCNSCHLFIFV